MSAFLTRPHRGSRLLQSRRVVRTAHSLRSLHSTPIALRRRTQHDEDELFSTRNVEAEDSIKHEKNLKATRPPRKERFVREDGRVKLRPEVRLARFNELLQSVSDRIGRRPVIRNPLVPNSAWIHLFDLATTPEQLEQVTELFSRWRDSKRVFGVNHAEAFIRRCEELKCPPLALKVFGDHSKYGFELKSLAAAQHLLHSLHVNHPLQDTIAAAALFNIYNLPPLSSDPLSTAMLTRACYRRRPNENALCVARALVPQLRKTLADIEPLPVPVEGKENVKEKRWMWLKWALAKVEKALQKDGEDVSWLRTWREKSSQSRHVTAAAAV